MLLTENRIELYGCNFPLNENQVNLVRLWSALIDDGRPEEYHASLRQALSDTALSSSSPDILMPFYLVEKKYNLCRTEGDSSYRELLTLIRESLLIRDVSNGNFQMEFFWITELMDVAGIRLDRTQRIEQMIQAFTQRYAQSPGDIEKFFYISFIFLLEAFSGNAKSAKEQYLERMFDLNVHDVTRKLMNIPIFVVISRSVFSDIQDFIEIINRCVFDDDVFFKKDADAQKSNFLWLLHAFKPVYDLETDFKRFYENWVTLFYKAIKRDLTELVFYMYHPISHIYSNLTQTQEEWKKFNEDVERPLSEYIRNRVMEKYGIQPVTRKIDRARQPVKIGFVYERIVMNSPFKVLYSLLKGLVESRNSGCEFYVYDMYNLDKSPSDPQAVRMIEDLGVAYVSNHRIIDDAYRFMYYSRFGKSLKLRQKIIDDGIDILIMCDFTFLFSTRTAPVQVYWTHGNHVYDVEGIDYRIMHGFPNTEKVLLEDHEFHAFPVAIDKMFYTPPVNMEEANTIRGRFPQGTIILGTIGRLIKVESDEYLKAVAEIMKRNPNTVYLACGTGGKENIKRKVEELGIADRFYFEGGVNAHVYGHVIDLYLDTFPLPSGESLNEYMAKGKPFVLLPDKKNDAIADVLQSERNNDDCRNITHSVEDYIYIADHLIRNKDCRNKLSLINKLTVERTLLDIQKNARSFVSSLERILSGNREEGNELKTACPVCCSRELTFLIDFMSNTDDMDIFQIHKDRHVAACVHCGTIIRIPLRTKWEDSNSTLKEKEYAIAVREDIGTLIRRRRLPHYRELKKVLDTRLQGKNYRRWIDVGTYDDPAGIGCPSVMDGYDFLAIHPNPQCVKDARRILNTEKITCSSLEHYDDNLMFDGMIFLDTFPYHSSPNELLVKAQKLLREKGLLVITINNIFVDTVFPGYDGKIARIEDMFMFYAPGMWVYYNKHNLEYMCNEHGFRLINDLEVKIENSIHTVRYFIFEKDQNVIPDKEALKLSRELNNEKIEEVFTVFEREIRKNMKEINKENTVLVGTQDIIFDLLEYGTLNNIIGFLDYFNQNANGYTIDGIRIISFEELRKLINGDDEINIVIASYKYQNEITRLLQHNLSHESPNKVKIYMPSRTSGMEYINFRFKGMVKPSKAFDPEFYPI